MYDWYLFGLIFGIAVAALVVGHVLYQFGHWVHYGYLWIPNDYKEEHVEDVRRYVIAYLVVALVLALAAGMLGFTR